MPRRNVKKNLLWVQLWGTPVRQFWTAVCGAIIITSGAITAVGPAWTKVEPHIPFTTAGYVREHVSERITPLEKWQTAQSVATDRLIQFQLEEYLSRAHRDPAAKNSPVVKERIQNLERQIGETKNRIIDAEKPNRKQ